MESRSQPTTPKRTEKKPPTTPTQSRYSRLNSPHTTPTKLKESQDRFMPARTPRSARIKLDFSDSDQGPMSMSPFTSPSPVKQNNDSCFVGSRLFRSARRNLYGEKSPSAGTTIQDGGSIGTGPAPEVRAYQNLIANELLGANFDHLSDSTDNKSTSTFHGLSTDCQHNNENSSIYTSPSTRRSLFEYSNQMPSSHYSSLDSTSPFSMSPLSNASQKLLTSPRKPQRKIPKIPFKVLDAPDLADDFYLNLVDWGINNLLAVGLGNCVYLWNATNSNVTKLCDYSGDSDQITAVGWAESGISPPLNGSKKIFPSSWVTKSEQSTTVDQSGTSSNNITSSRSNGNNSINSVDENDTTLENLTADENSPQDKKPVPTETCTHTSNLIAIGTSRGGVEVWDVETQKKLQALIVHDQRVGALAWNNNLVTSGSRDRHICQFDIRAGQRSIKKFPGHRQEVCGLRWSPDKTFLASGGNDNKLLVWSLQNQSKPQHCYSDHIAAVKAIAWSPHQHGLLASGGGTADRCIKFWNIQTHQMLNSIDTGSQVCNLTWSRHSNEVVSTHGYSQNQVVVWKYPSMTPIGKLIGHSYRVLFLAMSPDGESVVTGAGDETLRFWNVFSKSKNYKEVDKLVNIHSRIR